MDPLFFMKGSHVRGASSSTCVRAHCRSICHVQGFIRIQCPDVFPSKWIPNLRKLHINSFHDVLPMLPSSSSFSQLTTLILDGSLERYSSYPSLMAALLHCTPQLESLWMKHYFWDNPDNTSEWRLIGGRSKHSATKVEAFGSVSAWDSL
ncbi:hypothetical protein AX15_004608 [Amanita polypyramis BW_CC]|nr:hypothetical protein AX15_004608 [Amanita polypyramis BW_CC]